MRTLESLPPIGTKFSYSSGIYEVFSYHTNADGLVESMRVKILINSKGITQENNYRDWGLPREGWYTEEIMLTPLMEALL